MSASRRDPALPLPSPDMRSASTNPIIKSQWDDGEEKELIHQQEEKILQQQGRLMRGTKVLALIVTVIVLTLFFIIFTIIPHRSARRRLRCVPPRSAWRANCACQRHTDVDAASGIP